ncbi:MAG: prepilin-type N-terminal cleavage/methylation domain-containing protein [Myxococcales bacterium]|nr:prepilin-type N-terminal cleavage/methylation domain-containing protein [Myxococcales bacterium]
MLKAKCFRIVYPTCRGFSLIEVMTAAVVVSIGTMAAINVYTTGTKGRHMSRKKSAVVKLVSHRLDILDALGAEQLPDCSASVKSCRTASRDWAPEKVMDGQYPCTQWIHGTNLVDSQTSESDGKIRLDTSVWRHRDQTQRSESGMVMVSACWMDSMGRVLEFSDQRLVLDRGD